MTIETSKFVVQRGSTQYSCTGSTLVDKLQAGDLLVVRRGSTTYKYSYSNIADDILDSDLFVCTDTNDITYKVSGLRVKDLFGVSSITLGDPTPISSDVTKLLYNNSSVLNWTNAENPIGDTFPKVYFLEPGGATKNFIILDGDNNVVATTTSPTQQLPKVSEAQGVIKWGAYPLTQLIRPERIGAFQYVCNSIACHTFSDGEVVYIGTGGGSGKNSIYYYTSNPLVWENQSSLSPRQSGWGFFQVFKDGVIYVNPGDGSRSILKSTDRGVTFQATGVTAAQRRGFGYDAAIDTFFLDIGSSYQFSTDNCQTWTTGQWPISMSSRENVFQESANGFYACGGRHVLKYNPTTAEFDVLADDASLPNQCTGSAVNNLGEIIFVDINTGSSFGYAFIDANDNVSARPLTGAGGSAGAMRSIAWTDTADNVPGHFTLVGNRKVTTSEDGLNWIPAKQIANRALGIGNDPVSGNVMICGDGAPYVYLLSVNFDPNAQFANGTLTAELFNDTTLIAESTNVITVTPV